MTARVLVVGPVPPPIHGAARVTALVTENLRAAGVDTTVVDTGVGRTVRGASYHLRRILAHVVAVVAIVRGRRTLDAVYVGGAGGAGLWYQVAVVLAASRLHVQVVFHHHNYTYLDSSRLSMRVLVRAGGRQVVHVVLSPRMGELLTSRYPGVAGLRVCSNAGLIGPSASRSNGDDPKPWVLGHLSNLTVDKGLGTVIATARALVDDGVNVRLLLAGPTADDRSAELVDQAREDLGDAMEYLGPVPADRVDDFYQRIDLLLFPSTYANEAEPLVVLEASRWGVPTLAFDIGSLHTLIADDDLLVPVGQSFPAAARATIERLGDRSAREQVRAQVRKSFENRREDALWAHRELVDLMARARA